jgi:hypothetical protein
MWLVKSKIVGLFSRIGKEEFSVAALGDHAQEASWNDAIRINVIFVVDSNLACMRPKSSHRLF